jgi:DNA-binding transcriptional LysR family regulator
MAFRSHRCRRAWSCIRSATTARCARRSTSRAAGACNVTQPALTPAIQKLEDELGGPLFQRERNLTQLTELGRLMRPRLEQTLGAAEAAKEHAARFRKSEVAALRVGLPPTISARVALSSLQELTRRIPNGEVELRMADEVPLVGPCCRGGRSRFPRRARQAAGPAQHLVALQGVLSHRRRQRAPPGGARNDAASARWRDVACQARLRGDDAAARSLRGGRCSASAQASLRERGAYPASRVDRPRAGPRHLPVLQTTQARPLGEATLERAVLLAAASGRRYSPAVDAFIKLVRTRDFVTELALA